MMYVIKLKTGRKADKPNNSDYFVTMNIHNGQKQIGKAIKVQAGRS